MVTAAPGRVFLVGCPRSGSTLLQHLLAADTRIFTLPETHFVQNLLRSEDHRRQQPGRRSVGGLLQERRRTVLARLGWVPAAQARRAWTGMPDALMPGHIRGCTRVSTQISTFVATLDRQCAMTGSQLWLEKTPDHLFYLRHIQRHVPGARVIHLLRDGTEVVASLHGAARRYADWHRFADLGLAVDRWNHALLESLRWQHHPDHLLLRYEQLLLQPQQVISQLHAFMGLATGDAMPSSHGTHAPLNLVRPDEPWKSDAAGPLKDRRKFEQMFTPGQQREIRAGLLPIPAVAPFAPAA